MKITQHVDEELQATIANVLNDVRFSDESRLQCCFVTKISEDDVNIRRLKSFLHDMQSREAEISAYKSSDRYVLMIGFEQCNEENGLCSSRRVFISFVQENLQWKISRFQFPFETSEN
ncbi:MAG: hypothetical protein ABI778_02020 [Ignavibacteriota bacterium]